MKASGVPAGARRGIDKRLDYLIRRHSFSIWVVADIVINHGAPGADKNFLVSKYQNKNITAIASQNVLRTTIIPSNLPLSCKPYNKTCGSCGHHSRLSFMPTISVAAYGQRVDMIALSQSVPDVALHLFQRQIPACDKLQPA